MKWSIWREVGVKRTFVYYKDTILCNVNSVSWAVTAKHPIQHTATVHSASQTGKDVYFQHSLLPGTHCPPPPHTHIYINVPFLQSWQHSIPLSDPTSPLMQAWECHVPQDNSLSGGTEPVWAAVQHCTTYTQIETNLKNVLSIHTHASLLTHSLTCARAHTLS